MGCIDATEDRRELTLLDRREDMEGRLARWPEEVVTTLRFPPVANLLLLELLPRRLAVPPEPPPPTLRPLYPVWGVIGIRGLASALRFPFRSLSMNQSRNDVKILARLRLALEALGVEVDGETPAPPAPMTVSRLGALCECSISPRALTAATDAPSRGSANTQGEPIVVFGPVPCPSLGGGVDGAL
jgi:hypothetical protein